MSTEAYDQVLLKTSPTVSHVKIEDITEIKNIYHNVVSTNITGNIPTARSADARFTGSILLIRRRRNSKKDVVFVRFEIRSPIIQRALEVICGDTSWLATGVNPIEIPKPYFPLFHYRKELKQYHESPERSQQEKDHIGVLLGFMERDHRDYLLDYERLRARKKITFPLLWLFFGPNEEVVIHEEHYTECGVICSLSLDQDTGWEIITRGWDYNGSHFGPVDRIINVQNFEGTCDIETLQIYPLRYSTNPTIRERLIERGRLWKSLLNTQHRTYSGPAWEASNMSSGYMPPPPPPPSSKAIPSKHIKPTPPPPLIPYHVSGRIILDYKTHNQENFLYGTHFSTESATLTQRDDIHLPGTSPDRPKENDLSSRFMIHKDSDSYKMSDDQAILCPARIRGFSLDDKKFLFFLVEKVASVIWQTDAMDKLEIKPQHKQTMNALITAHGKKLNELKHQVRDFIPGKGLGLVFLFAGAPGLGKTLTAEVAAEYHRKPLYAITSGDISSNDFNLDQVIRKIFDRAKAWGAYLLLDEADVFLAERTSNDIQRNGLVTVFLRLIEYYQGVIFLTTNRLMAFDPAFESRIQLKLFYPPLSAQQRTSIWNNFLPASSIAGQDSQLHGEMCLRLGLRYEINGREIKNMIKVATAIANVEDRSVDEELLETVSELNQDWKRMRSEADGNRGQ